MRKHALHRWWPALFLALSVSVATPSYAQRERVFEYVRSHAAGDLQRLAERRVSLDQAVAIVQRQTGGKVLDARPQGDGYRVKVLTRSGDVVVVFVDGRTGDVH
ncbi:MAG: hypothetical protein K2Y35_10550 [Burkholderiales bacterium]|nr:hypothetical protein [Burkholderiales bacterium]